MNDDQLMLNKPLEIEPGIILRRACKQDANRLAEFNGRIHGEDEEDKRRIAIWSRDLINGLHPTICPTDFTVVEVQNSRKIVSSMNLISQTWTYDGIPFKVGRPEIVGTDPEYRHRGFVRKQFDAVHAWSQSRGEMVQGITGIPYYYRQFGYEMTVELDNWRAGYEVNVPALKKDEKEKFLFRKAVLEDVPYLQKNYTKSQLRYRLSCIRDRKIWEYDLTGRDKEDVCRVEIMVITTLDGKRVGIIVHPFYLHENMLQVIYLEIGDPANWADAAPAIVRYLWNTGQDYAKSENKKCLGYQFIFGSDHPLFRVASHLAPRTRTPYTWYIRIPNLPEFIGIIKPALDVRLARSEWSSFTGDVRIGFYRDGIDLKFTRGKIKRIETYIPQKWDDAEAAFPNFTFFHLIFGWKSMDDLRSIFPDCWVKEEKRGFLDALFPKQLSNIWPLQ